MGIETWEFFLDDTLVYRYSNTDMPLEHTRYILSLIHYPERATKGRSLLKTWVEPGNVMRDRMYAPSQGLFSLPDTMDHTLTVIVHDAAGNSARRWYSVKKRIGLEVLAEGGDNPVETVPGPVLREEYQQYFRWDQENRFAARDILITVPEKALYRDMLFVPHVSMKRNGTCIRLKFRCICPSRSVWPFPLRSRTLYLTR